MSSDTSATIPLQRSVPSSSHRFRLHRAGIRNVWQYDEQEFSFGDGRLLLRGKNGAGKSKALEMLLPYLLDGDSRALDATGTGRTTLVWLMLDGFEQTNRLGYLWVEFRMTTVDGGDRYLTLGAAIRASKSTKKAIPAFFVTPLRIGEDLHLVEGGKPLPVEKLKEKIGPDNVTERAVQHRSRVARELFGITDTTRYRNLTQLLHRLRRPTVGDRIESGGLVSLLSETLPGLEEEVVEKVARNLHDLDAVRDELGRLERTDTALRTFLTSYRGYLAGVLRRVSDGVSKELDALAQQRRKAGDAAKATNDLRIREAEADTRLRDLRRERERAQTELEALQASDKYRSLAELSERRNTVAALGTAAETSYASVLSAHRAVEYAADRLAEGTQRLGNRIGELAAEHRELLTTAEKAGLPPGHLGEVVPLHHTHLGGPTEVEVLSPAEEPQIVTHRSVTVPDVTSTRAALDAWHRQLEGSQSVVKHRLRMVQEVDGLAAKARASQAAAAAADTERERLEGEAEEAADQLANHRANAVEESGTYAQEVAEWASRMSLAIGPECPSLTPLRGTVELETSSDAPFAEQVLHAGIDVEAQQAAHAVLDPYGEVLAERRDALALRVSLLSEERDRLVGLQEEWERRTDPEPPVPYHRGTERAPGTGEPFFRLVDFADGLASAERAGLEAALEASGILDAWVTADGVVLDPLTRDTLFVPGQSAGNGATLGNALRAVSYPESVVTIEQVERILHTIALSSSEETTAASAVHYDGSWRLGALRGRHMKDEAEYVGAAVRAETRRRKLAELEQALAEVEQRLTIEHHGLAEIDAWRRALASGMRVFPQARRLAHAWSQIKDAETAVQVLAGKVVSATREAEEIRSTAVADRAEAEATATANDLPTDPDALSRVRTALAGLQSGIKHVQRAIQSTVRDLSSSVAEHEGYGRACDDRLEAEQDYQLRLDELRPARQALRMLEEAVGSAEDEILAREAETKGRIASAVRSVPEAQRALGELHDQRVRAEEKEESRRVELRTQETAVITAGNALRKALSRPEVLRGAGLDRSESPERHGDEPLADIRSRIRALRDLAEAVKGGLDQPKHDVSDSALLNRHTELRDQLAGGYDAQLEELDGIKVCRLLDDHGPQDVAQIGERIAEQAAEARGRLTEREREVFQRFLAGELGDHLSAQVITAANLVAALNSTLKTVRTSHGLGVELQWKLDEDVDADVRAAVELLRSPSGLRTREQTEQLREVLQRRIEDARRADPSAGYAAHLRTALDYRDWFRFHTFVVEDAAPNRKRRLTGRTGLSQGEQRVLSYLVLFAAAAAHFTTLGEAAPNAPRLILLDDAFAKVDEPTHGRLGRILVDLDLDFVLTSERLMGNWPEVPSLHIYECLRDPHVRGVATLHYTWNGRHRRLVSV
ncbi:TIGR02680 family protein [Streptomyces sp. NBRC 110028]|uniref:TIGR02680 family protein n=1 Tax=Streptomyces sp. NBRC 110028 TaxID=1621260 RepID=UPI0006E45545|nr:TIGR02680 family protein [Streptomyces sp. NBRC 110028]